jgi:competence protein CoiA
LLQLKIPFGLTADGRMVCVKEVGRGLSCECVCPECGCNLVARKGDVTVHHFAHQPKGTTNLVSCQNGLETSIHRMAKQILSERGGLKIPSIAASHRGLTSTGTEVSITKTTIEEHWISFDNLCLEHRIDPLRPDIVGYRNGKPFIIEVTVSNPIIAAKREVLRALQIPALEINLGNVTYAITRSDLTPTWSRSEIA